MWADGKRLVRCHLNYGTATLSALSGRPEFSKSLLPFDVYVSAVDGPVRSCSGFCCSRYSWWYCSGFEFDGDF